MYSTPRKAPLPLCVGTIRIAIRAQGLWRVWTGAEEGQGWEYFHSVSNAVIFAKALIAMTDAQQAKAESKQA